MSKFFDVLSHLRHDGQSFHPGDVIELADKAAQALLEAGAVAHRIGAVAEGISEIAGGTTTRPELAEVVIAEIIKAIGQLDQGNADHWLKDGRTPDVKALGSLLGYAVTAQDRDAAVTAMGQGR